MSTLREEVIDCGRAPLGQARSLPFAAFTDPELFALEQDQIFRRDWIAVCAEASLKDPGDFLALELAGEPLVVLRGRDGELRALSNVCRHRGTPIADAGFGKALKLVCPYHAWVYDDTGRLRGAPHSGSVEIVRDDHSLARFALDVWRGIVFVHLGAEPKPLADRLDGLDGELAGFDLARFDTVSSANLDEVWNANWKVVLENGLESYHIFKLHSKSLEPELPTRRHTYQAGGTRFSLTPGGRTNAAAAEAWPGISDFAREHYVMTGIPPTLYGGLLAEGWVVVFVHPLTPDTTRVRSSVLAPAGRESEFARSPFGIRDAAPVGPEDRGMCERVQSGMRSRSGAPGRLVELERVLVDFHAYLAEKLSAA